MNLANILTLSRLVAGLILPFFLTVPLPFAKSAALLLFLLASLTDYWDGRLARMRREVSVFGQLMDPLADKVLISSVFICFVALGQIVPAWIVVIIIAREFMVTGLRLLGASQGKIIPAGQWGKHKTAWQIIAITTILCGLALREDWLPLFLSQTDLASFINSHFEPIFHGVSVGIAWVVVFLTVVSGSFYFWKCREWVLQNAR